MGHLSERVQALRFRVATKFAVTFTVGALLALALVVTALALHERRAVARGVRADLQAQGDALAPLVADVLVRKGESRAAELLQAANAANASVAITLEDAAPPDRLATDKAVVAVPIDVPATAAPRVLVLEKAVPSLSSALLDALESFLLAGVPLGLFAMLSAYTLGEWLIGAPLRRVAEHTERIGQGDLEQALEVRGSLEIATLKQAINDMREDLRRTRAKVREEEARRVAAVDSLRHMDRLRTVGTLAAGIAHELGTPLNVILLEARKLERAPTNTARVVEGSQLVRAQATRMTSIVRQLLDFARRKSPAREMADAVEVASTTARLLGSLARARACEVEVESEESPITFRVDPAGAQQLLTNLLVNAFDAMPTGGRVLLRVHRVHRRGPQEAVEQSWVCFEVADEGTGMDDATRAHVFEPFFTTKDVGSGTGLGLSVALGIAEDHGGFVDVRPRTPSGTVFSVFFPADDGERRGAAPSDGAPASRPPSPLLPAGPLSERASSASSAPRT